MSDSQDRLSKNEHARIFQGEVLQNARIERFTSHENPKAVILAGQRRLWSLAFRRSEIPGQCFC
jgi:hypothetical protein